MVTFTIAAAHGSSILLDRAGSLAKACDFIREAGRQGVRLLCFPEAFVPGFPYWINLYPPGRQHGVHHLYWQHSVDVPDGDLAPVLDAARMARVNVVLGISERAGGTMYNSQVFVAEDGTLLGRHRKLQPTFAERMLWGQGDGSTLRVFDMPVGKVGGLICYEHMMNLARQALIAQGLQIHCASWPTFASTRGRGGAFDATVETLMKAHALTGQCFVVLAENPVTGQYLDAMEAVLGPQQELVPGGGFSAIYGPNGTCLAGPHTGSEERLVAAEIDLDAIARAKVLVDAAGHYARPEILRLVVDGREQTGIDILGS
ncbi:nitrilase-related carbon-nitrogen hydrolase [Enterovirga aerilata]|uniref:Carbon-nitrogen hydrolase family protein n=1 Tax=Enterovirga aerilata TaxID=2730920 RepID=A0A849HWG1_9HYPH|nr:carbon-nitrogen hydrolase family protein [Enterovirga sp. DB1703]